MEVKDRSLWEAARGDASEGYLFDEMTKAFTVGPSRRQALGLLAGAPWPPCSAGASASMRRGR